MGHERHTKRTGASRLAAALVGTGAALTGILVPLTLATATPAGADSAPVQATTSASSGLGPVLTELEGTVSTLLADVSVGNLTYQLGYYIEGHFPCPLADLGYGLQGVGGPPPCP